MSIPRATRHIRTSCLAALGIVIAQGAGCVAEPEPFVPTAFPSAGVRPVEEDSGDGGAATEIDEARIAFKSVEGPLVDACGSCHRIGGSADTPFLGEEGQTDSDAIYAACSSWPGVINRDPFSSVLLAWPSSGAHQGGPIPSELEEPLFDWLSVEAAAVAEVDDVKPTLEPFKPIVPGFNSIYLDELGGSFVGVAITFVATELSAQSLALRELQIHPTAEFGLTLEHPLFTVFAPGTVEGSPDPIDSFSNVAQVVDAGTVAPLGPGTLILSNWVEGGKLSIAFERLETRIAPTDPQAGCRALEAFVANAVDALEPCLNCHDGTRASATNAVDMTDLGTDDGVACTQILNRVDLEEPASSQLFVTTDPDGVAGHPYKFGGSSRSHTEFVEAVGEWLEAEAEER
ncbi:MAG: hypothetical protein AAGA56_09370 [Myxococcota bacterium]